MNTIYQDPEEGDLVEHKRSGDLFIVLDVLRPLGYTLYNIKTRRKELSSLGTLYAAYRWRLDQF
jgi:hypothetical protein